MAIRLSVDKLKNWQGTDGIGYQVDVLLDGCKVARVTDEGNGGPMRWELFDRDALQLFIIERGYPADTLQGQMMKCDGPLDTVIAGLADEYEWARKLARAMKTKTLFRLPTEAPDQWRTITKPYSPQIANHLKTKYPGVIILNEGSVS